MTTKKWINQFLLASVALFLSALACQSEHNIEKTIATDVAQRFQGTPTALQATIEALRQTPEATASPSTTPTPKDCQYITDHLGIEICLEGETILTQAAELDLAEDTPSQGGTITVRGNKLWVDYFNSIGKKLGVVRNGTTWPGQGKKFNLEGWMPDDELGSDGKTQCHTHAHGGHPSLFHCHFWDENILATVAEGMEYEVTGPASSRWIKDKMGLWMYKPGRIVTIQSEVTY